MVIEYQNLIPVMTSNTTPSGFASASSIYGTSNDAWKAFDGDYISTGGWSTATTTSGWLQYQFLEGKKIKKYVMYSQNSSSYTSRMPKDWTFLGSNDGTSWVTLDTKSNVVNWVAGTPKEFVITNEQSFNYYRINVTAINGGTVLAIGELQMMGITPVNKFLFSIGDEVYSIGDLGIDSSLMTFDSATETEFVNYGMNKSTTIDLTSEMRNKKSAKRDNVALGSGKVYTHTIDLAKDDVKTIRFQ